MVFYKGQELKFNSNKKIDSKYNSLIINRCSGSSHIIRMKKVHKNMLIFSIVFWLLAGMGLILTGFSM